MNRFDRLFFSALAIAATVFLTACDWSSGSSEDFNTSGGSANVNVSGFYQGVQGAPVVARTSRGGIESLVIQQSGNRIDVTDSNGSTYTGSIGSPNLLASGNAIPAGAAAATFQISFSGRDGVSAKDIQFTGVLTIVTVTNIFGDTDTRIVTRDSSTNVNSVFPPVDPDTGTGTETDVTTTTSTSSETNSTFSLAESNNQLQLRGTWIEMGGTTSSVRGIGPPAQGNITTTTVTPTPL